MGFGIGETIGPYKITAYLGQGGMATIYRAHQLTLDRDVALKVIHPALKDDESFLMRLNREAAIVARLNHPNIVTVYDYGQFEGTPYLVMRYIEGKTLKAVLAEQKLDIHRILTIACSIGNALVYAHQHGVLHRDVKPSNVIFDAEGNVFLTDFGLARLAHSSESTMSRDMLIGSPQYISPEQAKSEAVDERSDIYSFGIVLYEMFTGRVPFQGDTPYATIMQQINDPLPPPRSINPQIPPAVEMVLEKALSKSREQRYASVAEMITALENAIRGPQEEVDTDAVPIVLNPFEPRPSSDAPTPIRVAPLPKPRKANPGLAVPNPPFPDRRWFLIAGALLGLCLLTVCAMALSTFKPPLPFIAAGSPGASATTVGAISSLSATRTLSVSVLTPTAEASLPAATPTSTRIPVTVTPLVGDTARGKMAYTVATGELAENHSIWIANGNGTEAHQVIEMAMWPSLSPDGRQIAYVRMKDSGIYIANSDGGNARRIFAAGNVCCVQWSPDGKRLAYFQGDLKKRGGPIYVMNADGSNQNQIGDGFNPSWSPDGNRIVYTSCQPNTSQCGLFVMDLKTRAQTIITVDNGANPQWSPRADKVIYQADDGKGHNNVFSVNPDGSGQKQLTNGKGNDGQPTWSRDGNFILWRSDQNGAGWAIFSMRADGTGVRLLVNNVPASPNWGRESLSTGP